MKHAPIPLAVPVLLSLVAGFIDACTLLALFGLFVAQVTGSFVVAGAQLVTRDHSVFVKVAAIPVFFLAGVLATVIVAIARRRGRTGLPVTLALESLMVGGFAAIGATLAPFNDPNEPAAVAAALLGLAAMGLQSAIVRLALHGYASTNVMTTNTTQLAIDVTQTAMTWRASRRAPEDDEARKEFATARSRLFRLLPLILGFLIGTLAGGLGYERFAFHSLAVPLTILIGLFVWSLRHARMPGM
jgi:uncharacterized membrane protein YoaK (UPF0700 family)